jgi:rubrerythrin
LHAGDARIDREVPSRAIAKPSHPICGRLSCELWSVFICGKWGFAVAFGAASDDQRDQWSDVGAASSDEAEATSRADFVARAVVAGGALTAGGLVVAGLPLLAASAPSASQDKKILNFALLLEYIEAAFYAEAFDKAKLTGELRDYVSVVRRHEQEHVAFLKKVLGPGARKKPTLEFGETTSDPVKFTAAAISLEETMVGAYNGQAANLTKSTLAAAAKIVSVEARHAGWIRAIAGKDPAPSATDQPKTAAQVQTAINRTGFLPSS